MLRETIYEGYSVGGNPTDVQVLVSADKKESFLLLDRTFSEVDSDLGQTVSLFIEYYISHSQHPVTILDIAGGVKSQSAQDLANIYSDCVKVTNIDIAAEERQLGPNAQAHRMDALNLQFADSSFDLVYSYQFLPWLGTTGIFSRTTRAILEATRVLKPGGTAILHETFYSLRDTGCERIDTLLSLLQNKDTKILLRHPWPLLVLGKEPISPELALVAQEQYAKLSSIREASGLVICNQSDYQNFLKARADKLITDKGVLALQPLLA